MKDLQINTFLSPENVKKHVLIVGGEDPPLVEKLINEFAVIKEISKMRGFHAFECISLDKNVPFTLIITGIGPSCTEIAINELAKCGARIFLRAGTSGALSDKIEKDSVVITREALRFDGVSDLYVNKKVKAIAHEDVIKALINSAENQGIKHAIGVTLTTSAFYAMGARLDKGTFSYSGYSNDSISIPVAFKKLKKIILNESAINIDMETATLLILSRFYALKGGSVCGISNHVPWKEGEQVKYAHSSLKNAISVAVSALEGLFLNSI